MSLDGFRDAAREALLDTYERRTREEIAPKLKAKANENLRQYGQRHGYDVDTLAEAAQVDVERSDTAVTITLRYPDPAYLFEVGTVDHEVHAKNADVLSFVWEDPPSWVQEEFEPEGDGWRVFLPSVEVSGLPEAGFIRDTLNAMRQDLRSN